jgi:colicin import membrane protein
MRPALIKSMALHFVFPAVLVLAAFLLEKFWQRPELRVTPEYLEVSLLELPPVKKQSAPVKKSQPVQPPPEPEQPAKPEPKKPEPEKVEEPKPELPPEPKPEEQPIVEKTVAPTAKPSVKPSEKPKPTSEAAAVPSVMPSKKPTKKTPPPMPSLDDQLDDLLDDEQETLDELKKSQNKADQDKATAQARQADEQSMVGHYSALIRDRIEQAWSRPPSARPGMEAILQVKLLPGGEVRDVEVIKSSGDQAFDYSALKAIREARILPVPEDVKLFNQYFRVIQFPFRPEDLQR